MHTGSTSGLRLLPTLSSRLPCRLRQAQALFVRGHLTTSLRPTRSRISSTHRQDERNAVGVHDMSVMSDDYLSSSSTPPIPPLVPLRQVASARRTLGLNPSTPSTLPRLPTLPVNKDSDNPVVGIDSHSDTQDLQQLERVPLTEQPGTSSQRAKKYPSHRRITLKWVMLTTKFPAQAWAAYQELLSHQSESYRVVIPPHLLHRLVRLLATIKPRTRTVHLRLLSALTSIQNSGGRIRLWEWNTLLDSAGKNWRKTRVEDYEAVLDIFNNKGCLPAARVAPHDVVIDPGTRSSPPQLDPDIWTYNILLSIAIRCDLPMTVRHASSLLRHSGNAPNRITHLSFLRYFAARNDLSSVRSTLRRMEEQDLELGLEGTNACLWAYARNGHFDVALRLYRVLRSNIKPRPDFGDHDIDADSNYLIDAGLHIPDGLEPDEITYTSMIQSLAYHGNLTDALAIFVDMLSTPNREVGANGKSNCYKPSLAAFRGLFLGFSRHAKEPKDPGEEFIEALPPPFPQAVWDLDTLEMVFAAFLQLPADPEPTSGLLYWVLVAFNKTSGGDHVKLREVWEKLEEKYGGGWGGRLESIRESIFASEDQREEL